MTSTYVVVYANLDIVVRIHGEAMINSSRQDYHSSLLHPNSDPSFVAIPHIKVAFFPRKLKIEE